MSKAEVAQDFEPNQKVYCVPLPTLGGVRGDLSITLKRITGLCVAGVGFLAVWQGAVSLTRIPDYMLPTPSQVLLAFRTHYSTLLFDSYTTGVHAALGLAMAVVFAFILAVWFVHFRLLREITLPLIGAIEAVPKIALAPFVILWLGIGSTPKIVIAASIAFFPILVNLTRGLYDVDPNILAMTKLWKASWWRVLLYVRLPHSGKPFFDGLRIAVPGALIGALLAEFIASDSGLGYRILISSANLHVDLAFAALFCIAAMSFLGSQLIVLLERWLPVWRYSRAHQ